MTPEIFLLTALDSDIHHEKCICELKPFARDTKCSSSRVLEECFTWLRGRRKLQNSLLAEACALAHKALREAP